MLQRYVFAIALAFFLSCSAEKHKSQTSPVLPTENLALKSQALQFLFDKRLTLFNTRREHEWKVTFGAMVLIGAVDAGLLARDLNLTLVGMIIWVILLTIIFGAVTYYQIGIQARNRVDRVAMDEIYSQLCNLQGIEQDNAARACLEMANIDLRYLPLHNTHIFQSKYLWAFYPQTIILGGGCALSAVLPMVINGAFQV